MNNRMISQRRVFKHTSQASLPRALMIPIVGLSIWGLERYGKNNNNNDDNNETNPHPFWTQNESLSKRQSDIFVPTTMNSMSPTLPLRIIRPNPDLEIAFDVRTRNPVYVLERLQSRQSRRRQESQSSSSNNGRWKQRRPNFYEEGSLPEQYRSRPSHYRNSGFDRGHMAPAADFPHNPEDTFTLCNVSPQDHVMNLTIWNRLEEWTRRAADKAAAAATINDNNNYNGGVGSIETYVVTGPLWLPSRQVDETKFEYIHLGLGRPPSMVYVPTHFFKVVVVVEDNQRIQQFACFVVENSSDNNSAGGKKSAAQKRFLEEYVVRWTDLETVTGLQFFPNLVDEEWKQHADRLTQENVLQKNVETATSHQLLLTSGDSSAVSGGAPSKSPRSRWRRKGDENSTDENKMAGLVHLCTDGKCR